MFKWGLGIIFLKFATIFLKKIFLLHKDLVKNLDEIRYRQTQFGHRPFVADNSYHM